VPVETAKNVGYNYLIQHAASLNSADDLSLVYTSGTDVAYFYIFSSKNSFVLVSADDAVIPVIGYGTEGPFIATNISRNITGFFEDYNKQIDYVIKNNVAATSEIADSWGNLINNTAKKDAARTTVVSALLSTTWDQSPYYNDDCPYDVGASTNCVTGCVATATAQVMKFWGWPAHGVGLHSYSTSSYGTLSADFGSSTYSWSSMPNAVTSPNAAVAKLMSDVGISVSMDYSPTESSAYVISSSTGTPPYCAEYALKTYFNYDPSLHGEARASYTDATWISMLKTDLDAGHPIIYAGVGSAGGHCFVFDGYDGSSNFHVNWGWSGTDNGYFAIDALNPTSLGTGGGAGGFNSDQAAVLGVKPNTTSIASSASIELYDYVNLSASTINYDNSFTVSTNFENTGTTTFVGDFCAAAFDATTLDFITFIDSAMGETLPVGDVFTSDLTFSTTGLLSMLPGSYVIGVYYRPTGGSWAAVSSTSTYTNGASLDVVNHNYLELSAAITPTPTTFVEGSAASATLNVTNYGSSTFTGSLDLSLYNMDGSFNSTIQTMTGLTLAVGYTYTSALTFSTSSITAAPGTYYLALEFNDGTGWYLAGADYFENPITINVVAPPPSPDVYEVNNTAGTAYNLSSTLSWSGDVAHTSTPGSNFHVTTDQDYYKVVLPSGYNYSITARVNDILSTDDGLHYTTDAVWSYSTDGGATWSSVYTDVMPGTIGLGGLSGGTVIFHVSPAFAGDIGTYLLKLSNITRTTSSLGTAIVNLNEVKIYPEPASDILNIDLSNTGATGVTATLLDMQGRKINSMDAANQQLITMPLNSVASGMYLLQLSTDAGTINKKIIVKK
jgi:hypothetical protein